MFISFILPNFRYSSLSFVKLSLDRTMDKLAIKLAKFCSSCTQLKVAFKIWLLMSVVAKGNTFLSYLVHKTMEFIVFYYFIYLVYFVCLYFVLFARLMLKKSIFYWFEIVIKQIHQFYF